LRIYPVMARQPVPFHTLGFPGDIMRVAEPVGAVITYKFLHYLNY